MTGNCAGTRHTCQLHSSAQDYYFNFLSVGYFSNTFGPSHDYGEKGANILHLEAVPHGFCLSLQKRKTFTKETGPGQELAPSVGETR